MGESYGGHYVPYFAAYIMEKNDQIANSPPATSLLRGGRYGAAGDADAVKAKVCVPLQGVAIGDGLTNPTLQIMSKARLAYDYGLLNGKEVSPRQVGNGERGQIHAHSRASCLVVVGS